MKKEGLFIQERGLMLLIGLAVLTSGLLLFTNRPPARQVALPIVIHLDQVSVLLPTFVTPEPIDVNSATLDELIVLPGIGPALAQRIIDYRAEHGPFESMEDLERVNGIGPQTVENIRDEAVVGPDDL
jgi:competence ComEA-like helix-hairpin-helix protein